jgi:hypothetical protein
VGDTAGSGDAFDTVGGAALWLAQNAVVRALTINVAAGTYTETRDIAILSTIARVTITGAGKATTTVNMGAFNFSSDSNATVLNSLSFTSTSTTNGNLRTSGTLKFNDVDITNNTITARLINSTGTIWILGGTCTFTAPTATFLINTLGLIVNAGTLALSGNGTGAVFIIPGGTFDVRNAGKLSTPGTAKDIVVESTLVKRYALAANLLNGATVKTQTVSNLPTWSGWYKDTTTGLITQWGFVRATPGATPTTQAFPIAFPKRCFGCWAQNIFSGGKIYAVDASAGSSLTTISVAHEFVATMTVYWFALGY